MPVATVVKMCPPPIVDCLHKMGIKTAVQLIEDFFENNSTPDDATLDKWAKKARKGRRDATKAAGGGGGAQGDAQVDDSW